MFYNFFNFQARSRYLSFFSLSFSSILWSAGIPKFKFSSLFIYLFFFFFFFLLIIIRSGLLAEINDPFVCQSHRSLCISFSRTGARLCIYHLFLWSYLNFLHISEWITLSIQSCLVSYSFCANLLHSLVIIFSPWEFFTSALAESFPLEFEWQQVSSSLQDFSQYSDRSQQCCSLDSPHLSPYFQVIQSLYESFGDCTKSTNNNWYNLLFHVSQFFNSLARSRLHSLSLESEWQQVISSLQDSSQYSGRCE